MKKLVVILFFGLCAQLGFSQTYQFKTVNYSVSQKTEKRNLDKMVKSATYRIVNQFG